MVDYKELCDMVNNNHNEQKRKAGIHRVLAEDVICTVGCSLLFIVSVILLIACAG